ncbi:MAG: hypothetical protein HYV97_18700 [Bdellovibrio sp.]|nr:hypothetical protein [Bdellovibrio sp.]
MKSFKSERTFKFLDPLEQPIAPGLFGILDSYLRIPGTFENATVYLNCAVSVWLPKKIGPYTVTFANTHFPKTTLARQKNTKRPGLQK